MKRLINILTILLMLLGFFITVTNAQTTSLGSTVISLSGIEERDDCITFYWEGITLDSAATIWSSNLNGITKYMKEFYSSAYKWYPAYYSILPVKDAAADSLNFQVELWNNLFYDGENTAAKWKVRDTIATVTSNKNTTPTATVGKAEFANSNNSTAAFFTRLKVINKSGCQNFTFNFSIVFQKREFLKY